VKKEIHAEVIGRIDPVEIEQTPTKVLEQQLRETIAEVARSRPLPLTREENGRLVDEVIHEIFGLGPLEPLLQAPDVSDILVNGPDTVFVERHGRLEQVDVRFRDEAHLRQVIDRIVSAVGRRIDESTPMVDARLPDGSRFNAILPPLALDGPSVSIRRFGTNPIRRDDLVRLGALPEPAMKLLEGCVQAKLNVIVSGGTGSGKTTLLNVCSSFIPSGERIITIEDAAELRLQQRHVVRLETRPPNIEGLGTVTTRDLVRNALRMRPDRIIVGEIRGDEAIDMLQAMNTGHGGSLATIHANTPRHALARLEALVSMGMSNMPAPVIRDTIAGALNLVVQVSRLQDGRRRVMSITEVCGMESSVISTQELVRFSQTGVDAKGQVRGFFESTGVRPMCSEKLAEKGITLPPELFELRVEV
jgi:pilus assembly protein CpaF